MDLAAARVAAVAAVRLACGVTEAVRAELAGADRQTKSDRSPVTVADFAAQAILIAVLSRAFPDVPVVAEESAAGLRGEEGRCVRERVVGFVRSCAPTAHMSDEQVLDAIDAGSAEPPSGSRDDGPRFFWCIDPIDGTVSNLTHKTM